MASGIIPQHLIRRKRDGEALGADELTAFLHAYGAGAVHEYQMAAFLMAVFFRGMTAGELAVLVEVMMRSGTVVDLSYLKAPRVDKHSIGGVGDKVSLVLAPLVAAFDVYVPMMSRRGLGHTGGTVDKLEAIPGFRTELSLDEFRKELEQLHCSLIAPSENITPLDKRLYALRDVTGTVESIPLIASSIMSKKLAEGITGLVLDIKNGSGSFMPTLEKALELAQTQIAIGAAHGCEVIALVTAMDRPLGHAIGNAIETEEAILSLRGEGPDDLNQVTLRLAAEMLVLAKRAANSQAAYDMAAQALRDGRALEKFRAIIEAQGGNPAVIDDPAIMGQAPVRRVFESDRDGYVGDMQVRAIGEAAVVLGAGRASLHDAIDPSVGFYMTAKPGMKVTRGQPLATVFARTDVAAQRAVQDLQRAVPIQAQPATALPLISHRLTKDGVEELA